MFFSPAIFNSFLVILTKYGTSSSFFLDLEEEFSPKSKINVFILNCSVCLSGSFWWALPSLRYASRRDVCTSNLSKYSGIGWHSACGAQGAQKRSNFKNSTARCFPKILTASLKRIHGPCCEQYHAGTIFFPYSWSED